MTVSWKHALEQGPILASFTQVAASGILKRRYPKTFAGALPGPFIERRFPPPSRELVSAYLDHLGALSHDDVVPPHLFPKWCFAFAGTFASSLPWSLISAVNAGCRIRVLRPLPADEPLVVRACLLSVDEGERRTIVTERFITSTPSAPDALEAEIDLLIRHPSPTRDKGPKDAALVPVGADVLARFLCEVDAGLDFARLTGDFNPLHWSQSYARRAGFPSVILQGFGTMARTWVALERRYGSGQIESFGCRFLKPVILPTQLSVFADNGHVYAGESGGAQARLEGEYRLRPS